MEIEDLLRKALVERATSHQALQTLLNLARSNEIRDVPWESASQPEINLYRVMVVVLQRCWTFSATDAVTLEESLALSLWLYIHVMPEYRASDCWKWSSGEFIGLALDRIVALSIMSSEGDGPVLSSSSTRRCLQHLVLDCYSTRPDMRATIRVALHKRLLHVIKTGSAAKSSVVDAGNERAHVAYLLPILLIILRSLTHRPEIKLEIFHKVLVPLHQPNEMVLWRDQIPVIQTYHDDLVRCVVAVVECSDSMRRSQRPLSAAIKEIIKIWPDRFSSNTPKQVLMLHELQSLLVMCDVEELELVEDAVVRRLVGCIETENIRPAQRALQFFKSPIVMDLFSAYHAHKGPSCRVLHQLVEAMHRKGQLSWNPSVNKMVALGLKAVRDKCPAIFDEACESIFASGGFTPEAMQDAVEKVPADETRQMCPPISAARSAQPKSNTNLPRSHTSELHGGYSKERPPPLTVTGVAPWAMSNNAANAPPNGGIPAFSISRLPSSSAPRPVLGVHPVGTSSMAATPLVAAPPRSGGLPSHIPLPLAPSSQAITQTIQDQNRSRNAGSKCEKSKCDAIAPARLPATQNPKTLLMFNYMLQCFSQVFEDASEQSSSAKNWEEAQAGISPVLLPSLKFHDIVYGKVLGEGAFSVVKYARQIQKETTQSNWPEFAVKIISADRLQQHCYAPLALREIAILRLMVHPNICRLVSHFRYKDAIYLVLEYAAKGDLHSILINNGCLAHDLIRFIAGEVSTALSALHEMGFAFNDLKPENILVTARGHVKLADFGGSRPLHAEARDLMLQSIDAARELRSGDWREQEREEDLALGKKVDAALAQGSEAVRATHDERYEGTPAYMAPELFQDNSFVGAAIGTAADSWGLGCVLHFCLHGKPRFYGDLEEVRSQWREFDAQDRAGSRVHFLEDSSSVAKGSDPARLAQDAACEDLIRELLQRDPSRRPVAAVVMNDRYVTHGTRSGDSNEFNLPIYKASDLHARPPPMWPALDDGGGAADGVWARRQFSSLWAPMPRDFSLQGDSFRDRAASGDDPQLMALLASPLPAIADDDSSELMDTAEDHGWRNGNGHS